MTDPAGLPVLPPAWPAEVQPVIDAALRADDRVLVVLDDDPTGTQTVHGVAVLTSWDVAALQAELQRSRCFFVLTNSRAKPEPVAIALAQELAANLAEAARRAGRGVAVVSRSDSTLRGHFPAEVDPVVDRLGPIDAVVVAPWFLDAGRCTVHGVHLARIGDVLVPVGETEFARDASFGYRASALPAWIEEKTAGRVAATTVTHLDIELLRIGGPDAVTAALLARPAGGYVTADAVQDRDVEVVVAGLLGAEAAGRRYLYRTAASFVRVRAGIDRRPLLPLSSLTVTSAGAAGRLLVVGSHVARSTEQLAHVLEVDGVVAVELDVGALQHDDASGRAEVHRCGTAVEHALAAGRDVVLFTSRAVRTGADAASSLAISATVSAALVGCVRSLRTQPALVVAKGGITSSDIATEAFGVRRADVLGQVQPGVPVWELGSESRFPGMRYVVYPGNVGDPTSLAELFAAPVERRGA